MKNDSIKKYLIPNIPYLFVLWAFLKLGTAYRLAAGADFAHKLMGLGQTIGPAFADFAPGLAPFDWLVGIVGAVAFRVMVYVKSKNAKKFRRDEEYGSARWGCPKDIAPFVDPKFENNIILTGTEFLTMNTRPKNPANARNLNACVIGSSGSGKTRFWLTPQILQASADKNGGCSYVSRIGRDYLKVGEVMEMLRKKGVRLVAVNDNVDSENGDDDFIPFRNIMNEWYAKDTSKKIRSTFAAKGKAGKHVASTTPYGYLKDPLDHNHWIVDEEAADVVRRIFKMTIDGYGPYQISQLLAEDKIEIPAVHMARLGNGLWQGRVDKIPDPYNWGSSTVVGILKKREYLGETVNFKTRKHFKDKKSHYVPMDQWTVFSGTQEPIIDEETFALVQQIRSNVKRYPNGWGPAHPLTGLVFCADCGCRLYEQRSSNGVRISKFRCHNYTKYPVGTHCVSAHLIDAAPIMKLVSTILKACAEEMQIDEEAFVKRFQEEQEDRVDEEAAKNQERLRTAKRRKDELMTLLNRIYEDHILGKLPDERYEAMDAQYSAELEKVSTDLASCEKLARVNVSHEKSAKHFVEVLKRYQDFDNLTTAMMNEFVEKIVVYERDIKGSQTSPQRIDVYFNFIGQYIPDSLKNRTVSKEEIEEAIEKAAKRSQYMENYKKRKANGSQARYEKHTKGRRKAAIDAKKAALRAEDVANGLYTPVQPILEPQKGTIAI